MQSQVTTSKSSITFLKFNLKQKFKQLKLKSGLGNQIKNRRRELSIYINELFNSTVAYGPFKGLKLGENSWWGYSDRSSILFGLYEQEVLNELLNVPSTRRTFIDLGAANGYYGIGVLVSNHYDRSYCFEMSEIGREVIGKNAELNAVSNKLKIYGVAEKDFFKSLPLEQLSKSVLLVDIEGAEFTLLDADLFKALKDVIIIIEIHDFFFEDGEKKLSKLRLDSSPYFNITEITTGSRDLSKFPELKTFSDTDRWLICSEGRKQLMTWYRLDPK